MKALYYLEPWVELNDPFFRMGTYRDHVRFECEALIESGWDVTLVTSEKIKWAAGKEKIVPTGLSIKALSESGLTNIFPNFYVASKIAFFEPTAKIGLRFKRLLDELLDGFRPDVILIYESAFSSMFRELYRDIPIVDVNLGAFSRVPYPKTYCYDPMGSFRSSSLKQLLGRQTVSRTSPLDLSPLVSRLRADYLETFSKKANPKSLRQTQRFEATLLLPLQVSGYFTFDFMLTKQPIFSSQLEYLVWVLDSVPENIGVYVTEHSRSRVIDKSIYHQLKEVYSNFIYDFNNAKLENPSQYIVPFVDGVITVSSSVGYQAALFNKFLCVLGDGPLGIFSDSNSLEDVSIARIKRPRKKDRELHFLLTKYSQPFNEVVLKDQWLSGLLGRIVDGDCCAEDIYHEVLSDEALVALYQSCVGDGKFERQRLTAKRGCSRPDISRASFRIEELRKVVETVDAVSFDVFDTLLYRVFSNPAALLSYIFSRQALLLNDWGHAVEGSEIAERRKQFRKERSNSSGLVEDEEIDLFYFWLAKHYGLSHENLTSLKKIEIDEECRHLRLREDVFEFFEYCKESGRKVLLTSDMYLSKSDILFLLEKKGVKGFDDLVLSSDHGLLKRTGSLYDALVSSADQIPERILHIGDDDFADYQQALANGLKAHKVSKVSDVLSQPFSRKMMLKSYSQDRFHNLSKGVFASLAYKELGDAAIDESHFSGSWYAFGLFLAGPIMLGFSQWLVRRAVSEGVRHLYFLSRDGFYPMCVAEKIISSLNLDIQCHYVWASRKLIKSASLFESKDLVELARVRFAECKLEFFLKHRFDLVLDRDYRGEDLIRYGLDVDQLIDHGNSSLMRAVEHFLLGFEEKLLNDSKKLRIDYQGYLESIDFTGDEDQAIVDIGHNGSLQIGLSSIIGKALKGYYFATFEGAKKAAGDGGRVDGFLLNYEPSGSSKHLYCENLALFELLFIPPQRSVVSLALNQQGRAEPVYVELDETKRMAATEQIQQSVFDYCGEMIDLLGEDVLKSSFSKDTLLTVIDNFAKSPSIKDMQIFENIFFVDAFGGFAERSLIHPALFNLNKNINLEQRLEWERRSWWKAGAISMRGLVVMEDESKIKISRREWLLRPLIRPFVASIGKASDLEHFNTSPKLFFSSLNDRRYRFFGEIVFGKFE